MCGIAGLITTNGVKPDEDLVKRMGHAQMHRGPDQAGVIVLSGAGFAHQRLSIIDPHHGRQPMQSQDGRYTLVYNGEIYNYQALAQELQTLGHTFEGHCDTDTLLAAWQTWGQACIDRLRGMFAFALWDAAQKRLFLVRDRMGIKPLYYGFTANGELIFGSELKALLVHPKIQRALEPKALESYLALGYVPEPFSIFKNIFKLESGHCLTYDSQTRKVTDQTYWDISFARAANGNTVEAVAGELHKHLDEAVRMRLIADVPLGAFLSGGVDSSAIVALMAGMTDSPVNTCAIGFEEQAFDESGHARQIADQFSTRHREHRISGHDFGLVDQLIDIYDEPFADSSALPTYRVCELARQQVKVVLSGDGGDENFAGYRRYRLHMNESRTRARIPGAVRKPVFGALGRMYPKMDWAPRVLRAKTTFQALAMDTAEAYCHSVSVIPQYLREMLYSQAFKRDLQDFRARDLFREHASNADTRHPLSIAQYLDFKTYLPGDILTKVDRASMAHSLEVRVPLLDHEMVDWAAALSPDIKLHRGEGKYILKKAFEPSLPNNILYRKKKGFSVPLDEWFRGPLSVAAEQALTTGPLVDSGVFSKSALDQIWQQHVTGRGHYGSTLWSLLMLSRFLEREAGVETAVAQPITNVVAHA